MSFAIVKVGENENDLSWQQETIMLVSHANIYIYIYMYIVPQLFYIVDCDWL